MLAPLIADLAACTFKQDRTTFEKFLVGDKAFFSDKGLIALATADALYIRSVKSTSELKEVFKEYFESRDSSKVFFPKWFDKWCDPTNHYQWDSDSGMSLPMCCMAAPIDFTISRRLHCLMLSGKASGYAAYYYSFIIQALKSGLSKEDTFKQEEISMLPMWVDKGGFIEHDPYNALNSLILAWKAFDKSYDFTSSIKIAAELSEAADTRVVTMLAAGMAESFYNPNFEFFPLPEKTMAHYGKVIAHLKAISADAAMRDRVEKEILSSLSFLTLPL